MLCDGLEGWGGEREREGGREGGDILCTQLGHCVVQQKRTQHCKAIRLQFKKMHLRVPGIFTKQSLQVSNFNIGETQKC